MCVLSGLEKDQGMKQRNAKTLSEKFSKLTAIEKMLFNISARFMFTRR